MTTVIAQKSNGHLPSDWRFARLGELCEHNLGKMLDRQKNRGSERPYLRNPNVQWFRFDLTDLKKIPIENHECDKYRVERGDVIICEGGEAGRAAIWNGEIDEIYIQKALHRVRVGPELDSRYLVYCLMRDAARGHLSQYFTGTTIPHFTGQDLHRYEIPLPPLPEQKRIADILDKADAIRRKRQKGLDTLSSLRNSVFLRLFGDPRTQQTDWPRVNMGDVTILDARMVDPRKAEYIDLVHLGPDRIEKNTGRLLPALTAREERLISGKFVFDERYLIYSKIRPYLRKVALPDFKGLCSADVYPIRPVENKVTREFLFGLLISEAFLAYTASLPSRASIPKLNRKELAAYTFRLPPIELQQQYTEILRSHEQTTKTLGKASDESERLFNSLVQRAFKGDL